MRLIGGRMTGSICPGWSPPWFQGSNHPGRKQTGFGWTFLSVRQGRPAKRSICENQKWYNRSFGKENTWTKDFYLLFHWSAMVIYLIQHINYSSTEEDCWVVKVVHKAGKFPFWFFAGCYFYHLCTARPNSPMPRGPCFWDWDIMLLEVQDLYGIPLNAKRSLKWCACCGTSHIDVLSQHRSFSYTVGILTTKNIRSLHLAQKSTIVIIKVLAKQQTNKKTFF